MASGSVHGCTGSAEPAESARRPSPVQKKRMKFSPTWGGPPVAATAVEPVLGVAVWSVEVQAVAVVVVVSVVTAPGSAADDHEHEAVAATRRPTTPRIEMHAIARRFIVLIPLATRRSRRGSGH